MSIGASFLWEYDGEMATTRRVLERVPSDRAEWKPHPKSFPVGHLAQLISGMPGWITQLMTETELDLAAGGKYSFEKTEALLEHFDKNVKESRAALSSAKDADFAIEWSLRMGDRVLARMPRAVVARQTINHIVHHRGQMSVYLRLLEIPVPSIYGPTADEGWGGEKPAQ
jgi:uncharacterized damage-inducible protein DinB